MSPNHQASLAQERSIGDLFGDLASETTTLVRQAVKLATTEMTQKATYAGRQAAWIAGGALLGVVGLLALCAALVLGLGTIIPLWVSALLVGLVIGAVSYVVTQKGVKALKHMDPTPKQTIQSLQENKLWVQEKIR